MSLATLAYVGAVFALAGLVKGVIGLGLPTISMGLLAVAMSTLEAAAILVVPSLLTNLWQMFAGPSLPALVRRLWPMLAGVCLGTWVGVGLMSGGGSRFGGGLLGAALIVYAASGLGALRLRVSTAAEAWLAPLVGVTTGLVTAATGVFVIPAVPYLQALGLDKDDLVQALGLSFMVSTVALTVNVAANGALNASMAVPALAALALALGGMALGQALRLRLSAEAFRRCFFSRLALLGVYLLWRSLT